MRLFEAVLLATLVLSSGCFRLFDMFPLSEHDGGDSSSSEPPVDAPLDSLNDADTSRDVDVGNDADHWHDDGSTDADDLPDGDAPDVPSDGDDAEDGDDAPDAPDAPDGDVTPDGDSPILDCPCTELYEAEYESLYALLWPTCTAPSSSNCTLRCFTPVDQFIQASMIDELRVITVTIVSASSTSPYSPASSCYVRTDGDVYLGGPIAISDEQHMACVADILERESICRGCGWLDDC